MSINNRRMKILLSIMAIIVTLVGSCNNKPKSLEDKLIQNFKSHLNKTDTLLVLDSFKIQWRVTITAMEGAKLEDSIYSLEFARIKRDLNHAQKSQNADSIKFLEYEIGVMKPEIDSLTSAIKGKDSIRKFGLLVGFSCELKLKNKTEKDTMAYFIDNNGNILNFDFIDVLIDKAYKRLK